MKQKERLKFAVVPTEYEKIKGTKTIKGGYGVVTFMTHKPSGEKVVMKQTKEKLSKDENQRKTLSEKSFFQEVDVLSLFRHQAIVKFIGFSIVDRKGNIYLKYLENGSLDAYIDKNSGTTTNPLWDDTHKLIISYGIARAMAYLHSQKILHRDLKAENVLLDSELRPYIADFGTSKAIDDVATSQTIKQTTLYIMPPELIENSTKYHRSKAIDEYSYSMILYYLWVGCRPYPSNITQAEIVRKVLSNDRPQFPSETTPSPQIQELIKSCWNQTPEARLPFSKVCELLESPTFLTPDIDTELFQKYKKFLDDTPPTTPNLPSDSGLTCDD